MTNKPQVSINLTYPIILVSIACGLIWDLKVGAWVLLGSLGFVYGMMALLMLVIFILKLIG